MGVKHQWWLVGSWVVRFCRIVGVLGLGVWVSWYFRGEGFRGVSAVDVMGLLTLIEGHHRFEGYWRKLLGSEGQHSPVKDLHGA